MDVLYDKEKGLTVVAHESNVKMNLKNKCRIGTIFEVEKSTRGKIFNLTF